MSGMGAIIAFVSLFLTWGNDAGLIAGHSRADDIDLVGQSFNRSMVVFPIFPFDIVLPSTCVTGVKPPKVPVTNASSAE